LCGILPSKNGKPWRTDLRGRSEAVECGENCSEIVGNFARIMLAMRNMQITVVTCVTRLYAQLAW